jgi:hypothetical protein
VYADLLLRRFTRVARQFGFDEARTQLNCDRFTVPGPALTETPSQMSLF